MAVTLAFCKRFSTICLYRRDGPGLINLCSKFHTQSSPLLFQATETLWAEPMKKKKRVDPSVIAAKEQKKLKRIDKEIRRLTRFGRILKPVSEIEGEKRSLLTTAERQRKPPVLSFEESEARALLHKQWSHSRTHMWFSQYQVHKKLSSAQNEALEELRAESEDLYQAAIQIDYRLIPASFDGPRSTPAIKDYLTPDGEYVDTTRKY